jgi:hypothetical protein
MHMERIPRASRKSFVWYHGCLSGLDMFHKNIVLDGWNAKFKLTKEVLLRTGDECNKERRSNLEEIARKGREM